MPSSTPAGTEHPQLGQAISRSRRSGLTIQRSQRRVVVVGAAWPWLLLVTIAVIAGPIPDRPGDLIALIDRQVDRCARPMRTSV